MKVLVTGCAGHLARALLPRLCAHPGVERVIGVDLAPCALSLPNFTAHRLDLRSDRLLPLLHGCDAVIHLAFVVMGIPGRRYDRAEARAINVGGTTALCERAARAGVRHLIHLSSAAVYGAWPDNPARITENHALRPMPGFPYAEDKVAVETWLDEFQAGHLALRVVCLRPHAIIGPHAQPLLNSLLRQPFYPRLPAPLPLTQCVWEDDVAEAILRALSGAARGGFNIAADPPLTFRDMLRAAHRRTYPVPFFAARAALRAAWRRTSGGAPAGWIEGLRHSLVLDCTRAQRELGWQARLNMYDCLRRLSGTK